jgi:hypothetical protein
MQGYIDARKASRSVRTAGPKDLPVTFKPLNSSQWHLQQCHCDTDLIEQPQSPQIMLDNLCTVMSIEECVKGREFDAVSPILFPFLCLLLGAAANKGLKVMCYVCSNRDCFELTVFGSQVLWEYAGLRLPYSIALYAFGMILGYCFYSRSFSCSLQIVCNPGAFGQLDSFRRPC